MVTMAAAMAMRREVVRRSRHSESPEMRALRGSNAGRGPEPRAHELRQERRAEHRRRQDERHLEIEPNEPVAQQAGERRNPRMVIGSRNGCGHSPIIFESGTPSTA